MWMKPYIYMTRQIPNKFCWCCTCIAVNVHGCIHLPDVGQQLDIVEYINSGLIVEEEELGIKLLLTRNKTKGLSLYHALCWGCWIQCFLWHLMPRELCLLHCALMFLLRPLMGLSSGALDTHNWNVQFFAIKTIHFHVVKMGSWFGSISKCKVIIRSANHIHYARVITPSRYLMICICHTLLIFIIALQICVACVLNKLSIPMFVGGHNIGSA